MKGIVLVFRLGVLLVIALPYGGCSSSVSWLGRSRPSPSPHEQATDPATGKGPSSPSAPEPSPAFADAVHVVDVAFEVFRAELPLDGVRHSRKIWNHVDELRTAPRMLARLARNGVRVGAVSAEAWPAIRTILEAGGADVRKDQLLTPSGLPLAVEVGTIEASESVFSYQANNQLVGKTFTEGRKVINVDYAFHPEMGGRIDLQLGFEVRRDRRGITWERTEAGVRQVPAHDRHGFTDLRTVLALNPGESVILGPSAETHNEYLIGSRFFNGRRADERYENLYWLTPVPYQRPGAWQPSR